MCESEFFVMTINVDSYTGWEGTNLLNKMTIFGSCSIEDLCNCLHPPEGPGFVCVFVCECTHTPFILWVVIIFGFVICLGNFLP